MGEPFRMSKEERDMILENRKKKESVKDVRQNDEGYDKRQPTKNIRDSERGNGEKEIGDRNNTNAKNGIDPETEISGETFELEDSKRPQKETKKEQKKIEEVQCANCDTQFRIEDEDIPDKCPKCGTKWL